MASSPGSLYRLFPPALAGVHGTTRRQGHPGRPSDAVLTRPRLGHARDARGMASCIDWAWASCMVVKVAAATMLVTKAATPMTMIASRFGGPDANAICRISTPFRTR